MSMFPDRFAYPRVDQLLEVNYQRVPPRASDFRLSEGGVAFALRPEDRNIAAGDFLRLSLRFAYRDAHQDVDCEARCIEVTQDGAEVVAAFQFIDTAPEIVEGIRSLAGLHLLRLNREEAAARESAGGASISSIV